MDEVSGFYPPLILTAAEAPTRYMALKLAPWASKIVKTPRGWIAFDSIEDYWEFQAELKAGNSLRSPQLKEALSWLARNDEPRCLDASKITEQLSVAMISDLFGCSKKQIARELIRIRSGEA